ncbi:unnamed protein product [Vitrella brassicaformis CCMP3155]|uniref:Uncharacterized protein n=1 Tax=Vitrella brassicaformis (strain CCMP3155) TaxID=1169540 RepID=A0A0G4FM07_VITBC|nr:unnamed protein product [Vitrella brassicaformis CCMP3155]|eukprot:CEM15069.1 unnamed protein product [Vitrella brassicaformis CCMP3155]
MVDPDLNGPPVVTPLAADRSGWGAAAGDGSGDGSGGSAQLEDEKVGILLSMGLERDQAECALVKAATGKWTRRLSYVLVQAAAAQGSRDRCFWSRFYDSNGTKQHESRRRNKTDKSSPIGVSFPEKLVILNEWARVARLEACFLSLYWAATAGNMQQRHEKLETLIEAYQEHTADDDPTAPLPTDKCHALGAAHLGLTSSDAEVVRDVKRIVADTRVDISAERTAAFAHVLPRDCPAPSVSRQTADRYRQKVADTVIYESTRTLKNMEFVYSPGDSRIAAVNVYSPLPVTPVCVARALAKTQTDSLLANLERETARQQAANPHTNQTQPTTNRKRAASEVGGDKAAAAEEGDGGRYRGGKARKKYHQSGAFDNLNRPEDSSQMHFVDLCVPPSACRV